MRAGQSCALTLGVGLGLVGLTAFVFSDVGSLGWVEYDDPEYVTRNAQVRAGLTWQGLQWALTSLFASNWFPLTWLSHMLDYEVWGEDLGGFHITNLCFHVLNTLLVFGLLLRTTGRLGRAGLVAVLFAVHPLHVESVAWLSERKGLLSSFFALGMLHAHVGFARDPSRWRQLAVALWFAGGLASKPMIITMPFVLLLLDAWPLERLEVSSLWKGEGRLAERLRASGLRDRLVEKGPLWGLLVFGVAVTLAAQSGAIVSIEQLPLSGRLASAGLAYLSYLELAIWPSVLSPIHPHPGAAVPILAGGLALLGVVGLSVLALTGLGRHRAVAVGWLWFVGMLVPVVGFVQVGSALIAERYTYLPLVGLFIAVVWPIADLVAPTRWPRRLVAGGAVVVVSVAAGVAHQRVLDWRDTVSLFSRAVETDPSSALAHAILGLGYARARQEERAIEHYRQAATLRPQNHLLLYRQGRRLVRKGKLETAERVFAIELSIAPRFAPARNERALLWLAQGRQDEARSEFESILEDDAKYLPAKYNLGRMLVLQDPLSAAGRRHLQETLALGPDRVDVRQTLGQALLAAGEPGAARVHLEAAERLAKEQAESAREQSPAPRSQP